MPGLDNDMHCAMCRPTQGDEVFIQLFAETFVGSVMQLKAAGVSARKAATDVVIPIP